MKSREAPDAFFEKMDSGFDGLPVDFDFDSDAGKPVDAGHNRFAHIVVEYVRATESAIQALRTARSNSVNLM